MTDCLILNYNDYKTTEECAMHLANLSNIRHILLVDNHSTDDSYNELKKITNDKIIVIKTDKNGGYGYGNNFGIEYLITKLNSKKILICNPDTKIEGKTVNELEKFIDNNKKCVMVSPVMTDVFGKKQINTAFRIPSTIQYIMSVELIYSKLFNPLFYNNFTVEHKKKVGGVSGSLFLLNCQVLKNCKIYDENIFLYNEEITLAKKFEKEDLFTYLLTDYTFIHEHSVSISKTYNMLTTRQKILIKSHQYVLKKYFNANMLLILLDKLICFISLLEHYFVYIMKKVGNSNG